MTGKEIFLKKMWNYLNQKDNIIVYSIKSKGVVVETIAKPVIENKNQRLKELKRFKGFVILDTEKLFMDEALSARYGLGVNGFRDIIGFFKRSYISSSVEERKKLIGSLNQILTNTPYNFLIETLYPYFESKLSTEDFVEIWKTIPNTAYELSSSISKLTSIYEYIENLNIPFDIKEEILLTFISKNAGKIRNIEKLNVFTRDYLLQKYAHNKENIDKYIPHLPILDMSKEEDNSYMENKLIQEILYVEINCEKLQSIIRIPAWKIINYKGLIENFLNVLFLNYDEIRSVKLDKIKDENKKDTFSILITKKIKSGISQKELEELLKNLFQFFSSNHQSWPIEKSKKEEFLKVWLKKHQLDKLLVKKEESNSKVRKI